MWASDVQLLAVVDTADEDRAVKKRGSTHHVEVAVRVVVPGGSGVGFGCPVTCCGGTTDEDRAIKKRGATMWLCESLSG